jgi:hypothetical protein
MTEGDKFSGMFNVIDFRKFIILSPVCRLYCPENQNRFYKSIILLAVSVGVKWFSCKGKK